MPSVRTDISFRYMKKISPYLPGILLFIMFSLMAVSIYQDYGQSYDEFAQRQIGLVSYKYIFNDDKELDNFVDRDHGVGFELPLLMLEKPLGITDTRDITLMRHIVTHLFAILCLFTGYMLTLQISGSRWIASFIYIMLVLHPRLYAHTYFNTKDIPSMALNMVTLWAAFNAFQSKRAFWYILTGIVCGYAISIRLMNVLVVCPLIVFFIIDVFSCNKQDRKKQIFSLLSFVFAVSIIAYACWPTLWAHPIDSLISSFKSLSKFRWEDDVLLAGRIINATKLPWYYIPLWFTITIPELWLLAGIAGITISLYKVFKNPIQSFTDPLKRSYLLWGFCFFVPVIMVIALHSILYDDWRHLYFIYPSFIMLLSVALIEISTTKWWRWFKLVFTTQLIYLLFFMWQYHPYQQVYFNHLVSHKKDTLMKNYELDYWASSYKDGLEWILQDSDAEKISINHEWIIEQNANMLTPEKRKRFIYSRNKDTVDYFIQHFCTRPYKHPKEKAVFEIEVLNSPILRVAKPDK